MNKKILTLVSSLAIALTLNSCATTSNCANGKCAKDNPDVLLRMPKGTPVTDLNSSTVPKTEFDQARTKLEMSIIHKTPTPIWVPPVMAKVLIMPYVDQSGVLHSYQYVFTQLTKGHWLMGKYLANNDQGITEHPLSTTTSYPKVMQPLQQPSEAGMPQTPGVMTNTNETQPTNAEETQPTNENQSKSFFEGGAPKKSMDTNIPENSGTNNNQQYFNNTLNSMKSGS